MRVFCGDGKTEKREGIGGGERATEVSEHPFTRNSWLWSSTVRRVCRGQCGVLCEKGRELARGRYFRFMLLGYFECLDSERAMAWRAADSLGVRWVARSGADRGDAPNRSTISRTRRLIDLETIGGVHVSASVSGDGRTNQMQNARRSTPRRSKRTRPCAASSCATPGRRITSF